MPHGDAVSKDGSVIVAHYTDLQSEEKRLREGSSRIEFERTKELLRRFLPPAPATVLDVGGGPGAYAEWFARSGYRVHLIDLVPLHVEQALRLAADSDAPFTAEVADARRLPVFDGAYDVVLLFGPLYHLVERGDRLAALREAKRVARAGGLIAAAAISRLASVLDGIVSGHIFDERFRRIVQRDLASGQHRNEALEPAWFTTAFFHAPSELRDEFVEAGCDVEGIFGVEGPAWFRPELWDDPANREALLWAARMIEEDADGTALSAHLLAIARA